jgi:flagellar basal-body rod protein FlgF/flagellar basal-body rod protein FlgG
MQALELVAHNLANLDTAGYRGQQTTFRSLMTGKADGGLAGANPINAAINNFGVLSGSRLDLSSGSIAPTGNPLDVAIAGGGFFSIQSGSETHYTRAGSFHLTSSGQLVTGEGDAVLGQTGPITLPNGNVAISSDGTISVNETVIDKLSLAEFVPSISLSAAGNSTYVAPPNTALPAATSSVRQGILEGSNVSATEAVVQLITVQRNAEMLARALSALDGQLNQVAVQDLPKV